VCKLVDTSLRREHLPGLQARMPTAKVAEHLYGDKKYITSVANKNILFIYL